MKKLILVLAMLVASPVFAALDVNLVLVDSDTVSVVYTGADSANLPRAFALTITIDGTGTFTAIGGYKTGESTAASPGFGIFPARIAIDSTGTVTDYGTPLADTADPGAAGTGLGTNTVILEFGSLYSGSANAPLTNGTLCTLDFNKGTATQISLADETTYRGGIVLEDGTQLTDTALVTLATPPSPATNGTPTPNVTGTGALNTDLAWTAGAGATSYDVSFGTVNPPPFVGNTAGTSYEPGVLVQGKVYYVSVVAKNDAGSAAALSWSFNTECLKNTLGTEYTDWVAWGKPSCWCYQRQCRGDINGLKNLQWVQLLDLNALKAAYQKTDAQLAAIPNGICADINHTKNLQRVQLLDLNILKTYYQKADASVPVCDVNKVNFWTN